MKKHIFLAVLFLCITHCSFVSAAPEWLTKMVSYVRDNWGGIKDVPLLQPQQVIEDIKKQAVPHVSDAINQAVYVSYIYYRDIIVNFFYEQAKAGLKIGTGIAVTGVTILVIYKIYDKYLRNEQTKEKTEDEIGNEIYASVSDELEHPTHSSQLHMALKKDGVFAYLDDTNPIFKKAYDKAFEKIALDFKQLAKTDKEKFEEKKKNDREIDSAMNAIMQEIISSKGISIPSDEEKLKYIIEHYIKNKNKFDAFRYLTIGNLEMLKIQLLKGEIPEKDIEKTEEDIQGYKEGLLEILKIPEQRAAYALYLQLKNKISVEKMLTPEQLAARNPFGLKKYYTTPPIKKEEQQVKPSSIIPVKKLSPVVNDKGENLEQQLPPLPSSEVKSHEREDIPEEMQREVPLTSASSAGAA